MEASCLLGEVRYVARPFGGRWDCTRWGNERLRQLVGIGTSGAAYGAEPSPQKTVHVVWARLLLSQHCLLPERVIRTGRSDQQSANL